MGVKFQPLLGLVFGGFLGAQISDPWQIQVGKYTTYGCYAYGSAWPVWDDGILWISKKQEGGILLMVQKSGEKTS